MIKVHGRTLHNLFSSYTRLYLNSTCELTWQIYMQDDIKQFSQRPTANRPIQMSEQHVKTALLHCLHHVTKLGMMWYNQEATLSVTASV